MPSTPSDQSDVPDCPDFRLTIRRSSLLAVDWQPWLVSGGPMTTMLYARGRAGVALADVTVIRDGDVAAEAVVHFLAGDRPAARSTIQAWAGDVGYRRLWLPDTVVELPGPGEGHADTRCRSCGVHLCDASGGFWQQVRRAGRFPAACPLCGAEMPQWRVHRGTAPGEDHSRLPAATQRQTP